MRSYSTKVGSWMCLNLTVAYMENLILNHMPFDAVQIPVAWLGPVLYFFGQFFKAKHVQLGKTAD